MSTYYNSDVPTTVTTLLTLRLDMKKLDYYSKHKKRNQELITLLIDYEEPSIHQLKHQQTVKFQL